MVFVFLKVRSVFGVWGWVLMGGGCIWGCLGGFFGWGGTDVRVGMSFWQAARKAVVMNVSDFAAKGCLPVAALVSLGLPGSLPVAEVEAIAAGLNAGAREYGAYVIGGDTREASDGVIAGFLFGTAE